MPAAKFTRATPVECITCGCLFTPVAYRPDRNKMSHSPGRTTCSKACYIERLRAAHSKDMIARFWSKVDKRGEGECWPWMAGRHPAGYGLFGRSDGGSNIASRSAYEFAYGKFPAELHVRHKCDNPCCCNPAHLELGTHADNMRDRVIRGRSRIAPETIAKISASHKGKTLSAEHRAKLSAAKKGKRSPKAMSVVVAGITYASKTEAARTLKICKTTLEKMLSAGR